MPDGVYRPVVKLVRSHRTITLPNEIKLDTMPPKIVVKHPQYPIISPDGDGHHDAFTFHYAINEPAHAILLVRGDQVLLTRTSKQTGELVWNGRVDGGKRAPPGRYVLSVSARDIAGNVAKGVPFAIAQVRYLIVARKRVVVRPGGRFALRVSTDAPFVHWRLNGRSGVQPRGNAAPARAEVERCLPAVRLRRQPCRRAPSWSSGERRSRSGGGCNRRTRARRAGDRAAA